MWAIVAVAFVALALSGLYLHRSGELLERYDDAETWIWDPSQGWIPVTGDQEIWE